jgi:hypothetical protein
MTQQFPAAVYELGINPCVEVPIRVSRLFINGEMRERAQVDVGSRITLILRVDSRPRRVPIAGGFARALQINRNVRVIWELLTPSRQKEVLRYLNFAKRPETLWSNIMKVIALLQKKLPPRGRRAGIRVRV